MISALAVLNPPMEPEVFVCAAATCAIGVGTPTIATAVGLPLTMTCGFTTATGLLAGC